MATVEVSYALEVQDAMAERQALVQMYQMGYLDGWMESNGLDYNRKSRKGQSREMKIWARISPKAEAKFSWRFMRKIGRNIRKIRGIK